jgi:hypothetical protein
MEKGVILCMNNILKCYLERVVFGGGEFKVGDKK